MRIAGLVILLLPLITPVKTTYEADFEFTEDFSKYEKKEEDLSESEKKAIEDNQKSNFLGDGYSSQVRMFFGDLKNIKESKSIKLVEEKTDNETTPVAVKIFKADAEWMIEQEIKILVEIKDKGIEKIIPEIYRYGKTNNNSPFIIMEYLDGTLLDYLKEKKFKLSLEEKFDIFIKLVELVEKLHEKKIVHCDVKLENIGVIRTHTLTLKLLDFNLSTSYEKCPGGTKGYVAPEIWKEESITDDAVFKSDIYSLGILLLTIEKGNDDIINLNEEYYQKHDKNDVHYKIMIPLIEEKKKMKREVTRILN